ncbi:UbiA family prenyltransferase [Bradyrhizobium liaoningense]|uniref:UbiA family prenyltransferase n=1 Tax=Bradyrhizobium liaoningense TaxID=43992 RepID=UPI001BA925C5|nr:UbiA family prenyltransferase [Bradyrhizobium liaoningense]MBR0717746.1 UbiA family prenyltransferase [Bradyrhizobium liaoningense]
MNVIVRTSQLVRWRDWWFSKLPPALAILYLEMGWLRPDGTRGLVLLACYLGTVASMAAYGHVINDIADVSADRRAGKPNRMEGVDSLTRILLCGLFILTSFAAVAIANLSAWTYLVVALNLLWPTIYSLPPLRLKERRLAGVCCDVLGSHITPTLLAIFMVGGAGQFSEGAWFPFASIAWAAALGTKGILHHQIADRANDLRSGTETFATSLRPEGLNRFLPCLNLGMELPVSILLALLVWSRTPFFALALVLYCLVETTKFLLGYQFALTSDPSTFRSSTPFTNESFYVIWAPLAAAVQLPTILPGLVTVPLIHLVLFYPALIQEACVVQAVVRNAGAVASAAWRH